MSVIDHFLYPAFYLPARSSFIDCPCGLDPSPWHGGLLEEPVSSGVLRMSLVPTFI